MIFTSAHFVVLFFPLATLSYFLVPHRFRWILLLALSCYFYMAFIPRYLLILIFTICVDYCAGIQIAKSTGIRRKLFLLASLAANVGVLFVFKYWDFAASNFNDVWHALGHHRRMPLLSMALPIGLSFHTFQSMAYTIEVYRGRFEPERHFGMLALYVLFFPQLVAGPIERPQHLLPQLRARHDFDYYRAASGLRLMTWGFFQKMVIADQIAPVVERIYSDPVHHSGFELLVATVLFAFQILCDFSGYSDIAIGCARILGIDLTVNFRAPYLAQSIREFWKRWHISLTSWFRDYVYIPLGGNRVGRLRHYANVMAVFLLSGLWHGANWTYLAWGALNGIFFSAEDALGAGGQSDRRAIRAARTVLTFCLVCVTWIFFRAQSIQQAVYILGKILHSRPDFAALIEFRTALAISSFAIAIYLAVCWLRERTSIEALIARQSAWVRWPVYAASLIAVLFLMPPDTREFIYFQF